MDGANGHPRATFEKLRRNQLHLELKNCQLARTTVTYLGFKIGPGGVGPDPSKAKTIRDWPEVLNTRQQGRAFLGVIGYYRRMIPKFNKLAHPLHQL